MVGRAFLLLGNDFSTEEKVKLLKRGLRETERRKLLEAAKEVECDAGGVDSFQLGLAATPAEGDACGIVLEDQMVPMEFVRELKEILEKSKVGSSTVG